MSDDPVRTRIQTDAGELSMQEWFVGSGARPAVRGMRLAGIETGPPLPGGRDRRDQTRTQ